MSEFHDDDEIDAVLREVADIDVPEPSPLFWDHFGARVNRAIDAAPATRPWWRSPGYAWLAVAAALFIAVATFYALTMPREGDVTIAAGSSPGADPVSATLRAETDGIDIESDEAWAVVRTFADELEYDEAREAGVMPRAGSVERAATELSVEERAELVRLIEEDLKRTGA